MGKYSKCVRTKTNLQSTSLLIYVVIVFDFHKFNLELEDSDIYREDIKYWRMTAVSTQSPPQPMTIQFYLDITDLAQDQILVLADEFYGRHRVTVEEIDEDGRGRRKDRIMLESWTLTLSQPTPDSQAELPIVYKKSITFFRSLYAYVRLLPMYGLFKRLSMKLTQSMKIGHRFVLPNANTRDDGERVVRSEKGIGKDVPIIDKMTGTVASEYQFTPIETPLGVFSLEVIYRNNCDFYIDDDSEASPSYLSTSESPRGMDPMFGAPLVRTRSSSALSQETETSPHPAFVRSAHHQRQPSYGYGSGASGLSPKTSDARRLSQVEGSQIKYGYRESLHPQGSPTASNRPTVTMIKPFKALSLSSSPTSHPDNLPSPTNSDKGISSSPLYRSPSQVSLGPRYSSSPSSGRPLSIISNSGALSSSVKSTSSGGGSPSGNTLRFSSSFKSRYERTGNASGSRDKDGTVGGRRPSRSSLYTNRSDDTISERGSFSSSYWPFQEEDDLGDFVKMIETRGPLKMFSKSPTKSDDSIKEAHNNLSDILSSNTLPTSSTQLHPPNDGALLLGSGGSSVSSSLSSVNRSTSLHEKYNNS
ncbi:3119_t:CDS:2 [Paraglomus brasilianum]|uniref:Autophagy-related protein 13 n=1 Tax=Paraglomus brasilianum TaxID=144538 RepID=A0A9N9G6B1_9GLOM|nr:3119_t:CDS:2 [Paraglomus brasilianum]